MRTYFSSSCGSTTMIRWSLAALVAITISFISPSISWYLLVFLSSITYIFAGTYRCLPVLVKTFRRDLGAIKCTVSVVFKLLKAFYSKKLLRDFLEENVKKTPKKLAFIDADKKAAITFKEAQELCHRLANYFHEVGYRRGDVVALYMENRMEYMLIWLAMTMLGVITSLINYNLRGESLKHCIQVSRVSYKGSLIQGQPMVHFFKSSLTVVFPYLVCN